MRLADDPSAVRSEQLGVLSGRGVGVVPRGEDRVHLFKSGRRRVRGPVPSALSTPTR